MKTRTLLTVAALLALLGGALYLGRSFLRPPAAEEAPAGAKALYQCAMHPKIVSDKPGVCPICQMKLQRVDEAEKAPAAPGGRIAFYRHPMRPDVTSPNPAKDEMGMDYVPVYESELSGTASTVPGRAGFTLSAERQQLIGVTTEVVERRPLALEMRTVGKVAYDPALYQGVVEYREALRARGEIKDSPWRQARQGADALVRATALKLRQQGISEAQLREITQDGKDPVNLLLPDKTMWIYAQVYEYEVDLVHPGQEMVITAPSLPGRTFRAPVVAVDPILSAMTRSARVRALVPTPEASLRPETFVNVRIDVPLGEQVAVPESAVLDTGEHQLVFVMQEEGRFEPRAVQLGRDAGGFYEVVSGVQPGERVVTSANFLIDSESRFRAALAAFAGKPHGGQAK